MKISNAFKKAKGIMKKEGKQPFSTVNQVSLKAEPEVGSKRVFHIRDLT